MREACYTLIVNIVFTMEGYNMTLWDAWQEGGLLVPWSRLAKSNREKLFKARKSNAEYYLIGGERPKNKRQDFGHLVILEVREDGKGRILTDLPADKKEKYQESFREMHINVDNLKEALGFVEKRQQKKEQQAAVVTGNAYDPKKQYVVDREKVGRPRRVLSDEEQANISRLREQGMSINAISKELGINNRRVMEYCKNS